ncbi:alpha/beta fold hydrolase [Microbispora amethystogenes]|uniref:thioesterase II family protein n=1 Tax=Microbispora amethystogenes TaxID=1427754 RepID=UPI0033D1477C
MSRPHDTTVIRPAPRHASTRSLICLGFCGGGTAPYRPWASFLDERTQLTLICYPGREGRFSEPYAQAWEELTRDAMAAVLSAADKPYILFGHSMGGWMAFDVATTIEREGGPLPEALVVSSCNAPSRGLTDRDRFPALEDSDDALLTWMETIGLLPAHVRSDAFLLEMAYELMRADIRVRDSYRYTPGAQTSVPVQVLWGRNDAVIEPAIAEQWRQVCRRAFRCDSLPGGHFYTPDIWRSLPERMDALRGSQ